MKLSIASKLAIGFGIVVLLLAVVAGISIYNLNRSQTLSEDLIDLQQVVQTTNRSKTTLLRERASVGRFLLTGSRGSRTTMEDARQASQEAWTAVEEELKSERPDTIEDIASTRDKYESFLDDAILAKENNPDDISAVTIKLGEAENFYSQNLEPAMDALHESELEDLRNKAVTARQTTQTMTVGAVALGGASIVIAIGSAYFISSGITRSASHLSEAADSISRGDLDVPIEVNTGDEMEDLAESIERMRTSLRAAIERLRR